MTPEGKILRSICRWLDGLGSDVWYVKVRQGAYGVRGIPDLIICDGGDFIAIEVKAPGEDATPLQRHTLDKIRAAFGRCGVARSLEEAKEIVAAEGLTK